jgi:hypothetical protein
VFVCVRVCVCVAVCACAHVQCDGLFGCACWLNSSLPQKHDLHSRLDISASRPTAFLSSHALDHEPASCNPLLCLFTEVDPFNPYGNLPCGIAVKACGPPQGCVNDTIQAVVKVRPASNRAHRIQGSLVPASQNTLPFLPLCPARSLMLEPAIPDSPYLTPSPFQPTPVPRFVGAPYVATTPYPSSVALSAVTTSCGTPACTYAVRDAAA